MKEYALFIILLGWISLLAGLLSQGEWLIAIIVMVVAYITTKIYKETIL